MKTSVALCTYNGEKFLKQQIDSILNQTVKVDEIVVCDDQSTDATVSILNSYKEKHPDIFKIHLNEKNLRSVKNFEKAISLCENEIIFLCDQDDVWTPEKVEVYHNYFQNHPEIKVVASNGFGIDENGKLLDVITIWDVIGFLRAKKMELNFYDILNFSGNFATGATMAIKKEFLPKTLPFPIAKGFHHDEWLALVAAKEQKFDFIHDKTFYYRKHDNQQVGSVFYKNTKKQKGNLIQFFSPDYKNTSFGNYKFLLKRISKAYLKNDFLFENSSVHKGIFAENMEYFKNLFVKLKAEMKSKHPIRFYILSIVDSIQNKRNLERK